MDYGWWLDNLPRAFNDNPEREVVLHWIVEEWNTYATPKFGSSLDRGEHDEAMRTWGWQKNGFWLRQVFQYADRASLFMFDDLGALRHDKFVEKSKQAAMKMATTLIDGLASMVRSFGIPPAPGPSGEIKEWNCGR